jgi:MoaA/NifB/PqqE/SkfB family radical SAM enzyme
MSTSDIDEKIPVIPKLFVKWYAKSADLYVLFNTRQMTRKNPLLTLAPYGSLCWKGIINGDTVGQIRLDALNAFGCDEVPAFLKRLGNLEFIEPLPVLDNMRFPEDQMVKELHPPDVQFRLTHAGIPWYCLWEICTKCDLHCQTCYLKHFGGDVPGLEELLYITKQIIKAGIFFVSIMGGEPLLLENLEIIIRKLREAGVYVKIITNGQRLDIRRARSLAAAGLNQVEISFDGLCRETHDMSRGPGTFNNALRAVKNAQVSPIPRVGIVWTLHNGNIHELERLPRFMKTMSVTDCYLSLFKKTGKYGEHSPFKAVDSGKEQLIYRRLDTWKQTHPHLTVALIPFCTCGRTSLVIGENGDIRVCSFLYKSVGNIYRENLIDIWRSLGTRIPAEGPMGYCK